MKTIIRRLLILASVIMIAFGAVYSCWYVREMVPYQKIYRHMKEQAAADGAKIKESGRFLNVSLDPWCITLQKPQFPGKGSRLEVFEILQNHYIHDEKTGRSYMEQGKPDIRLIRYKPDKGKEFRLSLSVTDALPGENDFLNAPVMITGQGSLAEDVLDFGEMTDVYANRIDWILRTYHEQILEQIRFMEKMGGISVE